MHHDGASREELLAQALALGIEHPENMTRVELIRAVEQGLGQPKKTAPSRAGSWLEIARQLLAAVVEQGLNMPDAAALIRGETRLGEPPKPQPPLATVTLAKIYAAQGHVTRALSVLAEVLQTEPDHGAALELQEQIKHKQQAGEATRRRAQPASPVANIVDVAKAPAKAAPEPQTAQVEAEQTAHPEAVQAPSVAASSPKEAAQVAIAAPGNDEVIEGGEADVLLAVVRDGVASRVVWELSAEVEAARAAGNAVEIEWLSFAPSWSGPIRTVTRIAVTCARGAQPAPMGVASTGASAALVSGVLGLRQGHRLVPLATLVLVEESSLQTPPPMISRARASNRAAAEGLALRADSISASG